MNILKEKLKELGYEYYRRIGDTYHFRKKVFGYFKHITTDLKYTKIKKYYVSHSLQYNLGVHNIGELHELIILIKSLESDIKILKGGEVII